MRFLRWTVLVLVVCGVIGGLGYVKYIEIAEAIEIGESYPEYSESVEAVTSEKTTYRPTITTSGEVVVPNRVMLKSQHSGPIAELGFQAGEYVEEGQLLLQLDVSEEQARLRGARAEAELARLGLERSVKLADTGAVNRARLDQALAAHDIAQSAVMVIEETIAQKTITAPFSGFTSPGVLQVGQFVTAGDQVTTITGEQETVWVDFRIPQFLGSLETGAVVQVTLDGHPEMQGALLARDESVAASSRTRLYRAEVAQADAALSHGSYVEVTLTIGDALDVVDLPVTALQSDAYSQFLHVLEPAEVEGAFRAVRQDIVQAHYQGDRVLVEGEIVEGALIASDGSFKLFPGILTYVVDDLPEPASTEDSW